MRKIAGTILAGILASIALAVPSHANYGTQLCVDFGNDGTFAAFAAETEEDFASIAGLPSHPFPNSAVGCGAYDTATVAQPCVAEVRTVTVEVVREVKVPVEVIREVEVQDPTLVGKVSRLRAKVAAQRALIQRLRASR